MKDCLPANKREITRNEKRNNQNVRVKKIMLLSFLTFLLFSWLFAGKYSY